MYIKSVTDVDFISITSNTNNNFVFYLKTGVTDYRY